MVKVKIFWHERFLNAEFLYSGVCLCPRPYLSLTRMENISLGFYCHFFHNVISVISYEKTRFFLLSDWCLICKFNTEKKSFIGRFKYSECCWVEKKKGKIKRKKRCNNNCYVHSFLNSKYSLWLFNAIRQTSWPHLNIVVTQQKIIYPSVWEKWLLKNKSCLQF